MSTRSLIAKQIDENKFLTIYCHNDGYLGHNGALLIDYYNDEEKLDRLLVLGDISILAPKIDPDPQMPHEFEYGKNQKDVVVAYGRDRGDKNVDEKEMTLEQLKDPYNQADYVYIYSSDKKWQYLRPNFPDEGLRDLASDVNLIHEKAGVTPSENNYLSINEEIISSEAETKDFLTGTLSVKRTVQRINKRGSSEVIVGSPKSKTSVRIVPLPEFLIGLLSKKRKLNSVFIISGTEKPTEPRTVQYRFKSILRKCQLRSVPFHLLRHTYATVCIENGFDAKTLSELLGHADASITLNRYSRSTWKSNKRN